MYRMKMDRLRQFCNENHIVIDIDIIPMSHCRFWFKHTPTNREFHHIVSFYDMEERRNIAEDQLIFVVKNTFGLKETEKEKMDQWKVEVSKEMLNRIYGRRMEETERQVMQHYIDTDIASTYAAYNSMYKKKTQRQKAMDRIQNVIFNDPATIVIWADGSKTVVKAENEPYDPEKGLAMAIAKKFFDNKGYYFDIFKKWLPVEDEEEKLVVAINPETKSNAILLREYCDQENITKNKAMGQIHRGEILAFKNEKGLWMVVRD